MADRIPSSLKWLVEKRKRIHGEILYCEERVRKLLLWRREKLKRLKFTLEAIDQTIRLHEIQVTPWKIPPVMTYTKRGDFKYGELTQLIYKCLREAPKGLSTKQITSGVALLGNIKPNREEDYRELHISVGYRLKNLRKRGVLKSLQHGREVIWRLKVHQ